MPVLIHAFSDDEENERLFLSDGLNCLTFITYYGGQFKPLSPQMWSLYSKLLLICMGDINDDEEGFGYDYLQETCVVLKNYISRDPVGMLNVA